MKQFLLALCTLVIAHASQAQFTGGIRYANTTSFLSEFRGDVVENSSINMMGFAPFVNLESRHFMLQTSYTRYFNVTRSLTESYYLPYAYHMERSTVKYKPSELSILFGYKSNEPHPLKFFPMIGIAKYNLGIVNSAQDGDYEVILIDQLNMLGLIGGIGGFYTYNQLVFDAQLKFSRTTDADFTATNISIGVGVGYRLGKEPTSKEREKDAKKAEEVK